jgi:aspartate racemase
MKKIGIVYAISRAAGEHCRNLIISNGHSQHEIITHESLPIEYKAASNDIPQIAELIKHSVDDLARRDANVIIIAANSVHRAFDMVNEYVKNTYPAIELLSIVDTAVNEIENQNYTTVSIFGSDSTINSNIYQDKLKKAGIGVIILESDEQAVINLLITIGISPYTITEEIKDKVLTIANRLKESGCEAIILACTELPLVFNSNNLHISVIDTNLSLAKAAIAKVNPTTTYNITNSSTDNLNPECKTNRSRF